MFDTHKRQRAASACGGVNGYLAAFLTTSRLAEGDSGSALTATVPDSGSTRIVTPSSHSDDSGVNSESSVSVLVEALLSRLERAGGTLVESY